MNKKLVIGLVIGGVVTTTAYFIGRSKAKAKGYASNKFFAAIYGMPTGFTTPSAIPTTAVKTETVIPGNATDAQFNKLVEIANKMGSDWFQGMPAEKLKSMLDKWKTKLTKSDAETLITIVGKKEKDWNALETINFGKLISKLK